MSGKNETEKVVTMWATTKERPPIASKIVARGYWRSNETFKSLVTSDSFSSDIVISIIRDTFLALSGFSESASWQMKATSNGSFFLFPETSASEIEMLSINGHLASLTPEGAGITASLIGIYRLSLRAGEVNAADAYFKLIEFSRQHSEWPEIQRLID